MQEDTMKTWKWTLLVVLIIGASVSIDHRRMRPAAAGENESNPEPSSHEDAVYQSSALVAAHVPRAAWRTAVISQGSGVGGEHRAGVRQHRADPCGPGIGEGQ